jgi:quercetin dioxygenase-like cupin family protein
VPDYVHYHRVRFQVIFCKAGWVRLVYEDQGEPFILNAGDCVLQPPEIRHRVLESSAGAEVVELGCPAIHETHGDPEMALPTGGCLPQRLYQAQKFVRHVAAGASWGPSRLPGFEARDTGIAWATEGLGGVRVLRPAAVPTMAAPDAAVLGTPGAHGGEFLFFFVLAGRCELGSQALGQHVLSAGDSCVLPAGADYRFSATPGLELLEVSLPARPPAAGRQRPRT